MGSNAHKLLQEGRRFFEERKYDEAEQCINEYLQQNKAFPDVMFILGVISYDRGRHRDAIQHFEKAVAMNPNYMAANLNLAISCFDCGEYERGREAYDRYLASSVVESDDLHPLILARLANMHLILGESYSSAGRHRDALDQFRKAAELRPMFADVQCKLGIACRDLDLLEESEEHLRAAVIGNPRYLPAQINLGLTLEQLGRPAEARKIWQTALRQSPDQPRILRLLAGLDLES